MTFLSGLVIVVVTLMILIGNDLLNARISSKSAAKHQASINKRNHRNDEFPDYLGDYASSGWPDDSYTGCRPKTDLNTDLYSQYLEIASPDELTKDRMTWGTYRKLHDQNK